jgi:hypothetical protein
MVAAFSFKNSFLLNSASVYRENFSCRAYGDYLRARRGAGPFPREARGLAFPDATNIPNAWQVTLVGGRVQLRAIVVQQKTGRPVQFELLDSARSSILVWLERRGGTVDDFVFPSRIDQPRHISTRQYARLVDE